ncbi:endogenous retrovirus group S71 member 1 Env polyprotein-like [Cygnus atratus]|uniref:endogenous retrovirus group S71 member 1 Env polyprotein-like n=1 Tax=Cygnus atratus TaxID=8868 RepID=UPI0021B7B0D4|nr:endogenous retrovirus group S71 member 1 Env polyprotein-like [Cygnus atratus]
MMESGRINCPSTHHSSKPPPQNYRRTLPFWCMLALPLLLNIIPCPAGADEGYSHQPFKWTLGSWDDLKILKTNITAGAPSFNITNCELLGTVLGYGGNTEHHLCSPLRQYSWGASNAKATYWCPSSNPGKSYCNYPGHYFCAYWGCETIATPRWWSHPPDKYLNVTWIPEGCREPTYSYDGSVNNAGTCKSLRVTVLQPNDRGWEVGKTWGVRFWEPGADRGGFIFIKKEVAPPDPPVLVGPNLVLNPSLDEEGIEDK